MRTRSAVLWGLPVFALLGAAALWIALFQPMPFYGPCVTAQNPVDPERLETHVRMLAEGFFPRSPKKVARMEGAACYIRAHFKASGAKVEEQAFEVEGVVYRNIIARFAPKGHVYDPPLVIGAHYDSVSTTIGADDNASGVAGVLELARLLGENPPAVPVELVAWTLEEPPYFRTPDMGSAVYAGIAAETDTLPRLVIVLEMIGYFSTSFFQCSISSAEVNSVPAFGSL